jgi:hypothetical protein
MAEASARVAPAARNRAPTDSRRRTAGERPARYGGVAAETTSE